MYNKNYKNYLQEFKTWCLVDKNISEPYSQKQIYLLGVFFKNYNVFDINNIRSCIASLKPTKKSSTIQKYIGCFRLYNEFLIKNKILDTNFCQSIPFPKRDKELPVTLSIAEIQSLLDCKLSRTYGHHPIPDNGKFVFNTIIELLALTGCRVGEALSLKIQEIDWISGMWKLDHTKTRQGRLIPIPTKTLKKLEILSGNRNPDQYLFINTQNNLPMRIHQVENNFRLRLKEANVRKLATVHTLRHSFITELLRQNISISKIANIVGHSRIQMTADYGKLLYEDLRMAVMSHPLNIANNSPKDIINNLKGDIDKYKLENDTRFKFEKTEGNNYIMVKISY